MLIMALKFLVLSDQQYKALKFEKENQESIAFEQPELANV